MNKSVLILFLFILIIVQRSEAREWSIVGPRALGMGGANVAVANDATADYWNPAAYGFFKDEAGGEYGKRTWSAVIDAGAGAQIHEELGAEINKIQQYDFNSIQSTINSGTLSGSQVSSFLQLVNELKVFNDNPNRAATVLADGGLRIQVGHFGIGGYIFSDLSARGNLDLVNISPTNTTISLNTFTSPSTYGCSTCGSSYTYSTLTTGQVGQLQSYFSTLGWTSTQYNNFIQAMDNGLTQAKAAGAPLPSDPVAQIETLGLLGNSAANSGGSFANNTSALLFRGIAITEVPLTYGRAINEDLSIGGNLKFMQGRAYNALVPVFNTKFSDAMNAAKDNYKESQNFGLDLGLLYRLGDKFRFGMVGRNLNGPSFTMPSAVQGGPDDSIRELPQVRGGIAYKPFSFLILAADMDLTRNDTTIGGNYKSQNVGGGLELNIFRFLQLRAGAYTNLAQTDIGPVYTAGLGLNFWLVNLDIGAAMGSKSSQIDSNTIPDEARAEVALSMLF